jgi:hypothetical protein
MHLALSISIALLSLTITSTALPFRLFGSITAKAPTEDVVARDAVIVPSISALNYRIPEQRNHGLFDRPSPAIYPDLQAGQ